MVTIRHELACDIAARETLLTRVFGRHRRRKTSERLREDRTPAEGLAFTAVDGKGRLIGTIRLWDVIAGSAGPALLLGPLAVDGRYQKQGVGSALMRHALAEAGARGYTAVLLVGDAPYYSRFGFSEGATRELHLPGPVERQRFLGLELIPGALDGAEGLVMASGQIDSKARAAA